MVAPVYVRNWTVARGDTLAPIVGSPFATSDDAKTAAQLAAASSPGVTFVVFQAMYYAFVDTTPVTLLPVATA